MKISSGKLILLASICILLLTITSTAFSQSSSDKEFIRSIQVADQFFYFNEEYDKASGLYEALDRKYPGNSNILAKLGISYLNMDGKKSDALRTLIKASSNVAKSDDEYKEYGIQAPLDTWFYLAKAYHINDSLTKAIELYSKIKTTIGSSSVFRTEYVDHQIYSCNYAKEARQNPAKINTGLLIPWLKDFPGASYPVVSQNDSVFLFTVKKNERNHVYCSFNKSGWQKPVDITDQLNGYNNLCCNSITRGGDMIIVYMDDGSDGNLYSSTRKGQTWSRLKKLGKNINSKYWEAFGYLTPDGKQLYFSSNRPGGSGDLDIWVSALQSDQTWGPAVNPGSTINSSFNDNYPYFNPVSGTLIFSSEGHTGMGGYDVFISTLKNGKWSNPIGMPYPLNTTSNELMFLEDPGKGGFITSLVDPITLARNIYHIEALIQPSGKIVANGNIGLQDGMNIIPELAEVRLAKADTLDRAENITINEKGNYNFSSKPGEYILQIKYPGYKTDTVSLIIPEAYSGKTVKVSTSMIPEKVYSGDFLSIKNILFDFDSDSLNAIGLHELGKLISIMSRYPDLKIEVRGYTDIRGTKEYNLQLAERRINKVINYFSANNIPVTRFNRKAIGASDFVAINRNPDGSDNPEGRQYNRRVTLGIINPQTGISIIQESFTPGGLREAYSMRYNIVLVKSPEKYYPDYFREFNLDEFFFVRPVLADSVYLYVLGEFLNIDEAESYLSFVKSKGFSDAYIINSYEVEGEKASLVKQSITGGKSGDKHIYTIQLSATKTPVKITSFGLGEKVAEKKGHDGLYRYIYGEFDSFSKAKTALDSLQRSGQKNAFIKEFSLLNQQ